MGILERGDFVRGGFVLGGYCPGDIVRGDIVRGDIVLEPLWHTCKNNTNEIQNMKTNIRRLQVQCIIIFHQILQSYHSMRVVDSVLLV